MSLKPNSLARSGPSHQQEAESRWGESPEWAEAAAVQKDMKPEDWREAKAQHEAFVELLDAAAREGVAKRSERAREVVDAHYATVARWYTATRAKRVLLTRMCCQDPGFAETYHGNAEFLRELVEAQAEAEGLDLAAIEWG